MLDRNDQMKTVSKVATLWIGPRLPVLEQVCLKSWVLAGYEVTLFAYEEIQNVPSGVVISDATSIIPMEQVFQNTFGSRSFAGFSNVFRYKLLLETDFIWIDSDVIPGGEGLKDRPILVGWESQRHLNGAVLGIKDRTLCRTILEEAERLSQTDFTWGDLGPKLLTRALGALNKTEIRPRKAYYGLRSTDIWKLFDERNTDSIMRLRQRSEAVHLWSEGFKIANVNLDRFAPPEGSFLSQLESLCVPVVPSGRSLISKWRMAKWRASSLRLRVGNLVADLVSLVRVPK